MTGTPFIAEVGALMGDPTRANMLTALMDGRAWTAGELAFIARVSPQTASGHLAKLTGGGMLAVAKQGRHRYYRLASPEVARLLEVAGSVAANGPPRHRPPSRIDDALRRARTCYDHLAGQLGVAFADALVERDLILLDEEGGEVTPAGVEALGQFGVDVAEEARRRRIFCRPCLDWSERRPHIAGAIGAALASRCFELGWIERIRDSRAVRITGIGKEGLASQFGVQLADQG
jgi:DNA-binding transcriptional ArsR family regulator